MSLTVLVGSNDILNALNVHGYAVCPILSDMKFLLKMLGVKRIERLLPTGTPLTIVGEVCLYLECRIVYFHIIEKFITSMLLYNKCIRLVWEWIVIWQLEYIPTAFCSKTIVLFKQVCLSSLSLKRIVTQKDSQAIVLFKQLFSLKSIVNWIKISFDICDHILHLLQNVQYY